MNNTIYYTQNNIGSTSLLTDKDGSDIGQFLYTPFGEMWVEEASTVDISNITRFFTNQQYDKESGLYYYNARYYDPHLGSFITPDPAMASLNHYAYANSNPIRYSDPTGLYDFDPMDTTTWGGYDGAPQHMQDAYGGGSSPSNNYSPTDSGQSLPSIDYSNVPIRSNPYYNVPRSDPYVSNIGTYRPTENRTIPVKPIDIDGYRPKETSLLPLTPKENPARWPLDPKYGIGPTSGYHYGPRTLHGKPQFHASVDMPAPKGTPVLAYRDGVVVGRGFERYYGNYVAVEHRDGTISIYDHLNEIDVQIGYDVPAGFQLGTVGNTVGAGVAPIGDHLDFMIRTDGIATPRGAGTSARLGNEVTVNPEFYLP